MGNGHIFRGFGQIAGNHYGNADVGKATGALTDKGIKNKDSYEADNIEYLIGDTILSHAGDGLNEAINKNNPFESINNCNDYSNNWNKTEMIA